MFWLGLGEPCIFINVMLVIGNAREKQKKSFAQRFDDLEIIVGLFCASRLVSLFNEPRRSSLDREISWNLRIHLYNRAFVSKHTLPVPRNSRLAEDKLNIGDTRVFYLHFVRNDLHSVVL